MSSSSTLHSVVSMVDSKRDQGPLLPVGKLEIKESQSPRLPITLGQALLILLDKYKKDPNITAKLKILYLEGDRTPEDKKEINDFLKDPALAPYEIVTTPKAINNDPVRRYFESHLAYETLWRTLSRLDFSELTQFRTTLFSNYMSQLSSRTLQNNSIYGESKYLMSLVQKGRDKKEISEDLSHKIFFDNKQNEIIQILIEMNSWFSFIKDNYDDGYFPIQIRHQGHRFFSISGRGRTATNAVQTHHMGLMLTRMALSRNDVLFANKPFPYIKPTGCYDFVENSNWHNHNFARLVHPFVSSISGTLLSGLRICKREEDSFPFNTKEKLQNFIKCLIGIYVYYIGGHSFYECVVLFEDEEVIKEYPYCKDFNLENLFYRGNEQACDQALKDTIEYNKKLLAQAAFHQVLKSSYKPKETAPKPVEVKLAPKINKQWVVAEYCELKSKKQFNLQLFLNLLSDNASSKALEYILHFNELPKLECLPPELGERLLRKAIESGSFEIVRWLVEEYKINPHAGYHENALFAIAIINVHKSSEHLEIARFLVRHEIRNFMENNCAQLTTNPTDIIQMMQGDFSPLSCFHYAGARDENYSHYRAFFSSDWNKTCMAEWTRRYVLERVTQLQIDEREKKQTPANQTGWLTNPDAFSLNNSLIATFNKEKNCVQVMMPDTGRIIREEPLDFKPTQIIQLLGGSLCICGPESQAMVFHPIKGMKTYIDTLVEGNYMAATECGIVRSDKNNEAIVFNSPLPSGKTIYFALQTPVPKFIIAHQFGNVILGVQNNEHKCSVEIYNCGFESLDRPQVRVKKKGNDLTPAKGISLTTNMMLPVKGMLSASFDYNGHLSCGIELSPGTIAVAGANADDCICVYSYSFKKIFSWEKPDAATSRLFKTPDNFYFQVERVWEAKQENGVARLVQLNDDMIASAGEVGSQTPIKIYDAKNGKLLHTITDQPVASDAALRFVCTNYLKKVNKREHVSNTPTMSVR